MFHPNSGLSTDLQLVLSTWLTKLLIKKLRDVGDPELTRGVFHWLRANNWTLNRWYPLGLVVPHKCFVYPSCTLSFQMRKLSEAEPVWLQCFLDHFKVFCRDKNVAYLLSLGNKSRLQEWLSSYKNCFINCHKSVLSFIFLNAQKTLGFPKHVWKSFFRLLSLSVTSLWMWNSETWQVWNLSVACTLSSQTSVLVLALEFANTSWSWP